MARLSIEPGYIRLRALFTVGRRDRYAMAPDAGFLGLKRP